MLQPADAGRFLFVGKKLTYDRKEQKGVAECNSRAMTEEKGLIFDNLFH